MQKQQIPDQLRMAGYRQGVQQFRQRLLIFRRRFYFLQILPDQLFRDGRCEDRTNKQVEVRSLDFNMPIFQIRVDGRKLGIAAGRIQRPAFFLCVKRRQFTQRRINRLAPSEQIDRDPDSSKKLFRKGNIIHLCSPLVYPQYKA